MTNIDEAEIKFFQDNDLTVSIEELSNGDIVLYACPTTDESEETEVLVFAKRDTCQEAMRNLRKECEALLL